MEQLTVKSDGMFALNYNLSGITSTFWLGARPFTYNFITKELPDFTKKLCKERIENFGSYVKSLRSGEYIPKDSYSNEPTPYIYLSVNNFTGNKVNLDNVKFLIEEVGEKYKGIAIKNGDIIITRSGTVGNCQIFEVSVDDKNIYIPSHHLAVVSLHSHEEAVFLKNYLRSEFCSHFFWAFATGKSQKEITNWSIKRMPVPLNINPKSLSKKIEGIETQINENEKSIKSTQSTIDTVLCKYKVKSDNQTDHRVDIFVTDFLNFGERRYLRSGAGYHAFWEVHKGLLFDDANPKHPIYKLGDIIALHRTEILKKGALHKEYILLDLEDLEPLTGRILNEDKIIDEIGSDKVVFGDCDIIISKIDPYLAYIIINDKDKPLIGTTELLPFKLKSSVDVSLEYLKYLLLTDEYIGKSSLLMYGKRHPRIHPNDLLNIKVPIPDIKMQEKIVDEIKTEESRSFEQQQEIKRLRSQIDEVIYEAIKG